MTNLKTLSHILWGAILGAGITLGMFVASSFVKKEQAEIHMDRFYRGQMGMMADKNRNGILEDQEMYNLGLKLDVIKPEEYGSISAKDLADRIKNAPIERVKGYLDIRDREYDVIIPY